MAEENEVPNDDLEDDLETGAEAALPDDVEIVVEGDEPEVPADDEPPADEPEVPADDEPPADEPDVDPEDAELAAMPTKIKKRFEREKRLRDEIIGERNQARTIATQVAQKLQQTETETVTLRRQNAALQRQFAETLDYAYDRDISIKAGELRRAREDGNYDAEQKAQGELDQLRFQQNQLKQAKANLPPADAEPPAPAAAAPAANTPATPARAPVPPLAAKWVDKNKAWFNSPKFAGHRAFTLAEDKKLVTEGYDKNTPEYYAELDRRVDEAFPSLRKRPAANSAPNNPVAPVGGAPQGAGARKTIKITKADLQNMQRFGLDPSNKEHIREYARTKSAA
jgi:hypothetical protein